MGRYAVAAARETKTFIDHLSICFRWVILSLVSGVIMGLICAAFSLALGFVTEFRLEHQHIIMVLPVAGLFITFLYEKFGKDVSRGTNMALAAVNSNEKISLVMLPLIFVTSIISHLFGASVGREGAAIQMGASFGNSFSDVLKLNENDKKILIMTGMSAAFSALFGTPLAAAIFSMEVISVGVMYYAALVPCVVAALTAMNTAKLMGVAYAQFSPLVIPGFTPYVAIKTAVLGVFCAIVSIVVCLILIMAERGMGDNIKNPYFRTLLAGLTIVIGTYVLGTQDYNGLGTSVIHAALDGDVLWYAFILKMIFTAISLAGGYKGGEIVPVLFIGATFGCAVSTVLGLPSGLCAALGMLAVFCGVTNTPLASILIGIELFGSDALWFFCLIISISYMLSGYYGLYKSQLIIYSKYKSVYIKKNAQR